ncbi:MAG: peptide ABC transporter substrate-binding protein [Chloroflexi bacterium]|nr:peptide ABC transporter substrate-binding protein [Chloroflexota bacterium]
MKHIRWQLLIAVVGIAFLSVVLGYLALNTNSVERADFGGTYTEGLAGRPNAINPIFSQYNDVDRDIASLVFNGLTRSSENGTIQSDLATSWSISPDGLIYTFTLRSNVYWHDDVPFTADDVLFTIHSIQDPTSKSPPDLSAFWRTVAVTAVDAGTVRFQLTQPYAPFLDYTTLGILPVHVLKDIAPSDLFQNPFNRRPIGTGPFMVSEMTLDHATLDANPRYYGPRPYLGRVLFKFYPDYESAFAAYQRDEIEGIARIQPAFVAKARSLENLTLYNARIAGYSLVYLNLSKPAFQDKSVRQALLYAIDRQRIINDLLQGQGLLAASPIAPGTWAYNSAVPQYPFDVEKAKSILDNAGWKDPGDGVRKKDQNVLSFNLTTIDDPTRVAMANEIAKSWQAIGIKATVQTVPSSLIVTSVLRPRQFDAVLYDWRTPSNDPDQYENWHQTQIPGATGLGQNYSGLNDRDVSEALENARRTSDQAKRAELYKQFQELFADRVPALLLYYPVYTYGVDKRVHDVQLAPMLAPSDRFRGVASWYLKTKRIAFSTDVGEPTAAPRPTAVLPTLPVVAPTQTSVAASPTAVASQPTVVVVVVVATPQASPSPSTAPTSQCASLAGIIKSPATDSNVSGIIEIRGDAGRPNMSYWKLEYRVDSNPYYAQLVRSDVPVTDSVLSLWATKTVPNGVYWLQLTVVDNTGNFGTPCQIRVNVAN